MQKTIICKMNPSDVALNAINCTLIAFASACDFVLAVAVREKTSNKIRLQHLAYRDIREKFGLSANLAVRAIARVAWAIKAAKAKGRVPKKFNPTSIDYDQRIFSYVENEEAASITTVNGRMRVPLVLGQYQRDALRGKKPTAAKLVKDGKGFRIHIVIDYDPEKSKDPICAIGIDRGVYNLAVTSTGKFHSGKKARHIRERFAARRARLQSIGTKAAKRRLKRLSGRERRWMRDVNHCISKSIVAEAKAMNAVIVFEDLTGIRDRIGTFSRTLNRMVNGWAFRELEDFSRYKAEAVGLRVESRNPRNSSRTCPACGHVAKENRNGAHFKCVRCGYRLPADLSAARTISGGHVRPERAAVNRPMVSDPHIALQGQAPHF